MEHFEKSIIPVIESVYPSFTPLERTVADFFIHNTDESDLSARHVSELLYVSEASLSRFAKKCGYTGYREFAKRPRKWSFVLPMLTATASAPPARM